MNKKTMFIILAAFLTLASCGKKNVVNEETTTTDTTTVETTETTTAKEGELPKDKQNLLVFGSVLGARNNMPVDVLEPEAYKDASIQVLSSSWETTDTATAKETLDWLLNEGHKAEGDTLLAAIKEDATKSPKEAELYNDVKKNLVDNYGYTDEQVDSIKTISAWDYDRLVNVARFSYYAGYITEDEMWDYIQKAVDAAKKDYNTWEEYFAATIIGRAVAYGSTFSDSQGVADTLLKSPDSPYKAYPFK